MIDINTPSWWFGCWFEPGHHLFDRHGHSSSALGKTCPLYNCSWLDGRLAPRLHRRTGKIVSCAQAGLGPEHSAARQRIDYDSEELPQGQYVAYVLYGCSLISW